MSLLEAQARRIAAMETRTVRRRAEAALRALAHGAACAALDAGSSLATWPEGFVSFGDSTYTSASAIALIPGIQVGGGGSVTRFTERRTGTRTYTSNLQVNFGVADRGGRRPPTTGNDVNRRFLRGGASASMTWGGSRGPGGVQLETVVVGPVSGQFALGADGVDAAGIGLGVGDSYSLSGQLPGGFTYVCHEVVLQMTVSKPLLWALLVALALTLMVYMSTADILALALFPMLLSLGLGIVELASDLSRGKFDTFGFHIPLHLVFWLLLFASLAGTFWSRNGS